MRKKKINIIQFLPYLIVLVFIASMFGNRLLNVATKEVDYNEFISILETKNIEKVQVGVRSNVIDIVGTYKENDRTYSFKTLTVNSDSSSKALFDSLEKAKVTVIDREERNVFLELILSLAPILIIGMLGFYFFRNLGAGGANKQAFEFGESKARLEKDVKLRFTDVAGLEEEKEEVKELVDYLKNPSKFAKMGAHIPRGILLVGSPGTGKTLLAKALAGESSVPFYSVSGSDFMEMFVGIGASRVRKMFEVAKKNAPAIIFIDEIDTIGRQRGTGLGGGHDEREQTLNQLLVEMDGIGNNKGVVVIASTNRPDILDPALLRPGRFDRRITVSLPDLKAREEILKVHARNKHLAADINLKAVAKRIPAGFSGADIENVLNEAAILAVRANKPAIELVDIDEAVDRVMMGPAKKSVKFDDRSRKVVAYHEAGHAIVGLNLEGGQVVQKVTIIPRGQAGGYNLLMPKEEKILRTKRDLLESIITYMGGRCAEEIFFDDVTTGAINDFENSTRIAKDMVTLYGMSDLGPVQYSNGSDSVFLGRDYTQASNASNEVAYEIDREVRKIVNECYDKAKEIILAHKEQLITIAEALLEVETLTGDEITKLNEGKVKVVDGELVSVEEQVSE